MHAGMNDEAVNLKNKYTKERALNDAVVCCALMSGLPLIVGLTGAASAGLGASYNAPFWNFKIGYISLAAGMLAYCSGFGNYTFATLVTLFGVSWLGGGYAQQQHPFISLGDNQLPVAFAFLLTAMFGAIFGLCCGAVNLFSYCCFAKTVKAQSDLDALENMRHALQRPLDHSAIVL